MADNINPTPQFQILAEQQAKEHQKYLTAGGAAQQAAQQAAAQPSK